MLLHNVAHVPAPYPQFSALQPITTYLPRHTPADCPSSADIENLLDNVNYTPAYSSPVWKPQPQGQFEQISQSPPEDEPSWVIGINSPVRSLVDKNIYDI
jgi:hypothetical protein